jgi:aldose sugar dehydrogenase
VTASEGGMLGIAIAEHFQGSKKSYVFLYFTEAQAKDGGKSIGNRVYKYELTDNKLVNPVLLLDLPSTPGPMHNGGSLLIGPDNNLYVTVGDVLYNGNIQEGKSALDGRSGILRVSLEGQLAPNSAIISNEHPLDMYYAYGIRNSFGIDFDPLTGKLWDTENGQDFGDEINLVEPGFNSGWGMIQGKASNIDKFGLHDLLDFNGDGKYSDPEFVWDGSPVGPTALKFFHSDNLGEKYEDDLFVGDFHRGNLYNFNLKEDRTALSLDGQIKDKTAEADDELGEIIFARGLGAITDIEVGPDGYLYILSLYQGGDNCGKSEDEEDNELENCIIYNSAVGGTIFKIYPSDNGED